MKGVKKTMPVHTNTAHTHSSRRDAAMEYDATYKIGKSTVHVVAPKGMSDEEIEKVMAEFHRAGWAIWNSFSTEKKQEINKVCKGS